MQSGDPHGLEIAIVGWAGRMPGAPSIDAFWQNLRAGVESIRDLSDDELRDAGVYDANQAHYVRRAADLVGVDLFDAPLFGLTRREAELTDPQFRVFLEDAWTALEDAGHLGDARDLRVGVFAGASSSSYLGAGGEGGFLSALGNARDYLATQVSYRLNLTGPSLTVQTACSTSLVAVHLACQSLLNHECDLALAGGVSIGLPQTAGYLYEEGDIASPDGRCRAFDAAAAGCIKGNGSGLVVLRRLEDALRDGDDIRAVIKGTAINNDGSDKVGFTAPSVSGQASVIREALAVAEVEPSSVDYVEAHGTATPLGDPIEVAALRQAFGPREAGAPRCALGSVKTNIGHLDAAAGVAGLLKAALALQHAELPPSLHFERPNPKLELESSAFFVNATLRPWPAREGSARRAGVSSFGIGGTNAHAVLEEAPASNRARPSANDAGVNGASAGPGGNDARPALLVLSAASDEALRGNAEALAARLDAQDLDLADVAFTLAVGRKRLPHRRAVAASTAAEAARALRASSSASPREERRGSEVVFLFPGQGAQHARMAAGLYASEPVFRAAIDRCAAIASPLLGFDWIDAVLGEGAEDERIKGTQLAQPSLFIVEFALAELLRTWGIEPAAMAGHSIGEWVAAHLAGVLSLEDALGIVIERGRLMGGVPPGAMLATTLGEEALAARLAAHPELSLAAINGPNATVASGPIAAIEALEAELHAAGLAAKRLHTSHAFHSAMMDEALDAFEARVRHARLLPPRLPFYSNLSGALIRAEEATDPRYWREHLRRSVRFADNLAACGTDRTRVLLEVGPGTALSSMARATTPGSTAIATMRAARGEGDDATTLRQALGQLWCAGVDLAWDRLFAGESRRRVPLPTYRFQRERYWIDAPARLDAKTNSLRGDGRSANAAEPEGKNPDLAAWFFLPSWSRTHLERDPDAPRASTLLLFDDESELSLALAKRARDAGTRVITLRVHPGPLTRHGDRFELDPRDAAAFVALRATLREEDLLPDQVLHLWCHNAGAVDSQAAIDRGFFALLHLLQAEGAAADGHAMRLLAVTRGLFDVVGEPVERPERAGLLGICRVAPFEYPRLRARLVDVAHDAGPNAQAIAATLLDELASRDREPLVAWRGGHRWVPAVEPRRLEAPTTDGFDARGKSVVLTGGAGPFELAIARRFVQEGARALVFLGCADSTPALAEFQQADLTLLSYPAHFDEPHSIATALVSARTKIGAIDLVLHTAGDIGGGLIQIKERAAVERVFAPRIAGARLLREQLREGERLVCFSSAISATGVFGQVDYCAASAAADAKAEQDPRVMTIGWGMAQWDRWQSAEGPSAGALLAQLREVQAAIGITIDEGVEALFRALSLNARRLFITTQDLRELVAQAANASVADFLGSMSGGSGGKSGLGGGYESETEARVAALWTELLGARDVGRDDNFFDLGGNSLVAIQLASQLRKLYDIELTIADLFASADLKSLAAAVDHALDDKRASDELARLLDEIESLSELEVKAELERDAGARG